MGLLRNHRYELYAQGVARGLGKQEAYLAAGYKGHNTGAIERRPEVHARIVELKEQGANRAQVSRKEILNRIFDDWETARKLGQMPAALKAAEMMGKEMHKMFVDRREIGNAGDFDSKSEEELKEFITKTAKELGINLDVSNVGELPNVTKGTETIN